MQKNHLPHRKHSRRLVHDEREKPLPVDDEANEAKDANDANDGYGDQGYRSVPFGDEAYRSPSENARLEELRRKPTLPD